MSINNLFNGNNDFSIYCKNLTCDTMTCNNSSGVDTIYNSSSSLISNRIIDLDGYSLKLGTNNITITDINVSVDQNITTNANITLNGAVFDHTSSAGISNQVLTTDGANVTWTSLPSNINRIFYQSGGTCLNGNFIGLGYNNASYFEGCLLAASSMNLTNIQIKTNIAPGIGNTYYFQLYVNGGVIANLGSINDLDVFVSTNLINIIGSSDTFAIILQYNGAPLDPVVSMTLSYI